MSKKKQTTENRRSSAEALKRQISELTEALQRERADSENIRRRHEEQIGALRSLVKISVMRELLPVIDNFERALAHTPICKDGYCKQWIAGVTGVQKQIDKTLNGIGVHRIKTVGQIFDPRLHEAVSMDEGAGIIERVSEELQPGYTLNDEVIRHARVKVKMEAK